MKSQHNIQFMLILQAFCTYSCKNSLKVSIDTEIYTIKNFNNTAKKEKKYVTNKSKSESTRNRDYSVQ